ncbi:MAG: phosphopantetheine-binding protein [Pseudomonadota bacterium]
MEQNVIIFVRTLCERSSIEASVDRDTDLFATGILDSMRFVELFGHIQADLGVDVPDKQLATNFFRTPAVIAKNFAHLADS